MSEKDKFKASIEYVELDDIYRSHYNIDNRIALENPNPLNIVFSDLSLHEIDIAIMAAMRYFCTHPPHRATHLKELGEMSAAAGQQILNISISDPSIHKIHQEIMGAIRHFCTSSTYHAEHLKDLDEMEYHAVEEWIRIYWERGLENLKANDWRLILTNVDIDAGFDIVALPPETSKTELKCRSLGNEIDFEWLAEQGFEILDQGRLTSKGREKYQINPDEILYKEPTSGDYVKH